MNSNIRIWKSYAKQILKGNYGLPMIAMLLVTGAQFVGSNLTALFFPGTDVLSQILGQLFLFIITLFISVLSAGMYYMYLKMSRGEKYSLQDMIYFFKNEPDRILIASSVLALISWITSLPAELYAYMIPMGESLEEATIWASSYFCLFAIGLFLNIIISVPFAVTYYLMADCMEISGIQALKLSMKCMRGYKIKYLLLQISFLPWIFLSIFTFYIALLWIIPYMEMANVMFYRCITGEFEPKIAENEIPTPYEIQRRENAEQESAAENRFTGDDYNSEA